MNTFEDLITALRQQGKRITPQREAICRLLVESDEHPTAQQIHATLQAQFPNMSLATVYNTLETLVSLGLIHTLGSAGDDTSHYDADTTPHVNLACISCHRVIDLPTSSVAALDEEVTQNSHYKLLGARLMYYGLCPECQQHQTETNLA